MFADVSAEAISEILLRELDQDRPDLVIYEAMNTGSGVAASVLVLVGGWIDPTAVDMAFVVFQALVVAALAEFQYTLMRRSLAS